MDTLHEGLRTFWAHMSETATYFPDEVRRNK